GPRRRGRVRHGPRDGSRVPAARCGARSACVGRVRARSDRRYTRPMPSTRKTRKPAPKAAAKRDVPAKVKPAAKTTKTQGEAMSLTDVMRALEKAGSEQTRKTYTRHGAKGPMFGVSFATLGALQKRIRVDHELALELWGTGNIDARNL